MCHGRIRDGIMGLHEGTEEILAPSNHFGACASWRSDRADARLRCGTVHLYLVLIHAFGLLKQTAIRVVV